MAWIASMWWYITVTSWWARWRLSLSNRLFRRRSKKTSKLRVTGLCEGNWWPVNSPHKGPVTRQMFPFDDVIKTCWLRMDNLCFNSFEKLRESRGVRGAGGGGGGGGGVKIQVQAVVDPGICVFSLGHPPEQTYIGNHFLALFFLSTPHWHSFAILWICVWVWLK